MFNWFKSAIISSLSLSSLKTNWTEDGSQWMTEDSVLTLREIISTLPRSVTLSFSCVHVTDLNCRTNNLLIQNQPQREKIRNKLWKRFWVQFLLTNLRPWWWTHSVLSNFSSSEYKIQSFSPFMYNYGMTQEKNEWKGRGRWGSATGGQSETLVL